jgi:hypothetical protein
VPGAGGGAGVVVPGGGPVVGAGVAGTRARGGWACAADAGNAASALHKAMTAILFFTVVLVATLT